MVFSEVYACTSTDHSHLKLVLVPVSRVGGEKGEPGYTLFTYVWFP